MLCSSCSYENREGAKFCNECGAPMPLRCPSCQAENREGARFCDECGMPLTVQTPASEPPQIASSSETQELKAAPTAIHDDPDGERRHLTVMFCDLVGSTPLSERLDPEDLRDVVRAYQEMCAEAISRFQGHIAKYMGDGLMVYFGYPQAHEDDAIRAAHAGLAILADMTQLNSRPQQEKGVSLDVRVGIHTGLVVAGEMGSSETREELAVVGETPNIASRLEGIAEPNTVIVSAATYSLIDGFFDCQSLGSVSLRGISQPMDVYRVLSESISQSRFEMAASRGLTPLVGREHEIALLLDRWKQAKEGDGQVVLLSGEPGIGKSRITQALREHVASEDPIQLRYQCSPYHTNSAFHPIVGQLERAAGFDDEDSPEVKLDKLESMLARSSQDIEGATPLLAALLSIPAEDRYRRLEVTPERQKEKTLEALVAQMKGLSRRRPVLLIFEDAHWADPTSLELLELVVEQAQGMRMQVVITFRPEFTAPWTGHTHITSLSLNRFSRPLVTAMVNQLTGEKPLPDEVHDEIIEKTDGVPLFVEELTKTILESGLLEEETNGYVLSGPLAAVAIPTTLHDSLMARLDRMGDVKEVAQFASAIGREFSYDLLAAVSPLRDDELQDALGLLVDAELVFRRGRSPQTTYIFKHALVQDAAYESLLRSRRQQLQAGIAHVLEERFPERVETEPEVLAHHFTEAGFTEQAIYYWQKAGQRAVERSASLEATSHFRDGLELLKTLPDTPARASKELPLQVSLGSALTSTDGYTAKDTVAAYTRAYELCQKVEQTPQVFYALYGVWNYLYVDCQLDKARELAEEGLRLAKGQKDSMPYVVANNWVGVTSSSLGDLETARSHMEEALALYDSEQHRALLYHCGEDPRNESLNHSSLVLWLLGYPDQALERVEEAITWTKELSYGQSEAYALNFLIIVAQFRRDWGLVQEKAEELVALCTEQFIPQFRAVGLMWRGSVLVENGDYQRGIDQLIEGSQVWGSSIFSPYLLSVLATGYQGLGQLEEALNTLDQALDAANRTGERQLEAEFHRLKGEFLLSDSDQNGSEAEALFRNAIGVAEGQNARSLELRAVMSLSRLLQQQGKSEEARQALAEIYDFFTEGFDTRDLKEARVLLNQLV